jgi:AcrR family transcriptional regulator
MKLVSIESSGPPPGTLRPGGRTARTAVAAHEAVLDLLAEQGREGLTMRQIAARSGVHEATLYRRWRDVDVLVLDAATERVSSTLPVPDTGSLRGDLRGWAATVAAFVVGPGGFVLFDAVRRANLSGTDDDDDARRRRAQARRYVDRRLDQLREALARASARGEPVPELEDILDQLIAPLYVRAAFGYRAVDQGLDDLVDNALRSGGGRPPPP